MTGPSIRLGSLPTFNAEDRDYRITAFDGWYGAAAPRAELVTSGGAPGAVAVGPWDDSEAYYTLTGLIRSTDRATLMSLRRELLAALPATEDVALDVLGNDEDVNLTAFVRRYDKPEITVEGSLLHFTFPLVATDPSRYGPTLASSLTMGVFTGSQWFTTFELDATPDPDLHYLAPDVVAGEGAVLFQQVEEMPDFPSSVTLTSEGDTTSRRLTIAVTGPVTQGDWQLINETTGDELYADLSLVAGQTVVFDCYRQRATLNDAPIDGLVFGDFLSLEPGGNTFRLTSGTTSAGFATIQEARPAYQ